MISMFVKENKKRQFVISEISTLFFLTRIRVNHSFFILIEYGWVTCFCAKNKIIFNKPIWQEKNLQLQR